MQLMRWPWLLWCMAEMALVATVAKLALFAVVAGMALVAAVMDRDFVYICIPIFNYILDLLYCA